MNDVNTWADDTFGVQRKVVSVLNHLKQEVPELIAELELKGEERNEDSQSVEDEFADCFILICNAAAKYGLSANQLLAVSERKMEVNKARKWGKPDANGVVNHVKEPAKKKYVTTAGGALIEDME